MQLPYIEAEEYVLTDIFETDAFFIARELNHAHAARYLYIPHPYSLNDAIDWLTKQRVEAYVCGEEVSFAIRKKVNNLLNPECCQITDMPICGVLTLRADGTLGFWGASNVRGKGMMTKAVRNLLNYCYNLVYQQNVDYIGRLKIPKVWIHDSMNINIASARVAYKLGFRFKQIRQIPSKNKSSHRIFSPERYYKWSQYQVVSEFELNDFRRIDALIANNKSASGSTKWPALIRYASEYAKDIELFFDQRVSRLSNSSDRKMIADELLQKIKSQGHYTDNSRSNKMHKMSSFRYDVLMNILKIPYGETRTYAQLAKNLDTKAVRALASVCKSNPLPIIIPCHRVVRGDGIGDYVFGKVAKKHFLDLESRKL